MSKRRTIFDLAENFHLDAVEKAVEDLSPLPPPLFKEAGDPAAALFGCEVVESKFMPEGMALIKSGGKQYLFNNGNMVELPPMPSFVTRMPVIEPPKQDDILDRIIRSSLLDRP